MNKILLAIVVIFFAAAAQARVVVGAHTSIFTQEERMILDEKLQLPETQNLLSETRKKSVSRLESLTNGFAHDLNFHLARKYSNNAVMPPKTNCKYNLFSIYILGVEESDDIANIYLYEKCEGGTYQIVEQHEVKDILIEGSIGGWTRHFMLNDYWVKLPIPIPTEYHMPAGDEA